MKMLLLLSPVLLTLITPRVNEKPVSNPVESHTLHFTGSQQEGKMKAIEFRLQEYCRAELENFDFDVHFSVVNATVYFSGKNFNAVERGFLKSASLRPIADKQARCVPGTIVTFDDVKVMGPDNEVRTIPGVTYVLQ